MKLLLDSRNLIIGIGNNIEYGEWGNIENVKSWRITPTHYMMDGDYHLEDIGDTEIPTYVKEGQYYLINGEFKLADECPNEYRDSIKANTESIVTIEDALCETEIANEDRLAALEDAICELSIVLTNM